MMRAATALSAAALALLPTGCIIDDTLDDDLREIESEVTIYEARVDPDGGGTLRFNYHYDLGMVDSLGIAEIQWTFEVIDLDQAVLGETNQLMRNAQPEKTEILVTGDRERTQPFVPGRLGEGETYILRITLYYQGHPPETPVEILEQTLTPVVFTADGVPPGGVPPRPDVGAPDGVGLDAGAAPDPSVVPVEMSGASN